MTQKGNKPGTPFPARKDFDVAKAKKMARYGQLRTDVAAYFNVSTGTLTKRGICFPTKNKPMRSSLPFLAQARVLAKKGMSQRQIAKTIGKSKGFLGRHGIAKGASGQKPIAPVRLRVAAEMYLYGATERFIQQKTGISRKTWRKYKPNWVSYLSYPKP